MTEPFLEQISGRANQLMADGGYDKEEVRIAIRKRKAKEVIPTLEMQDIKEKMMNEIRPY